MLVLSNEGGVSSSYARSSCTGPMDWFKGASGFDFEYSSNIQLRLNYFLSFFIRMFSPKENMSFFNIKHISIYVITLFNCMVVFHSNLAIGMGLHYLTFMRSS